jgi:hypothetical protein
MYHNHRPSEERRKSLDRRRQQAGRHPCHGRPWLSRSPTARQDTEPNNRERHLERQKPRAEAFRMIFGEAGYELERSPNEPLLILQSSRYKSFQKIKIVSMGSRNQLAGRWICGAKHPPCIIRAVILGFIFRR